VDSDGQPAGSYDFAGSLNYIELSNEGSFDFTSNFTVAFWVKANNLGAHWAQLVGKGDSSWSVDRVLSSGRLQFTTWAPGFDELIGQTPIDDGQWHHVAVVHDGSSKRMYVDGQLDVSKAYSAALQTNDVNVHFGWNAEYPSGEYGGMLDDVRIYKRALAPSEVAALTNPGTPPGATVLSPNDGDLFRAGDTINFSGSAFDAEDGILPGTSLSWEVLFHHNGQTDQVLTLPNVAGGSFTVPTIGLDSLGNISYEIRLTAMDSSGLTDTAWLLLDPERSLVTIDSAPPGIALTFDGSVVASPHSVAALVGYQHMIGAPDTVVGNTLVTFNSWSDNGAQVHTIVAPTIPASYVATYDLVPLDPAQDQDGDGLLNGWEALHGLDPFDPSDAVLDNDGDGLNNLEEQSQGTDPTDWDTDDDGASDGDEVSAGTDPLDPADTPDLSDPDLVGWYQFSSDGGGSISDSSGNGNDGSCAGGTCPTFVDSDGQPAGSYDFAGSLNYIELSNEGSFDFTSNFSVAFWVKANNLGAHWAQLVGKGDSSWSVDRVLSTGRLQFTTWAPGFDELIGQTPVDDGQWHHVAVVHDGSSKIMYVDGQLDASKAYSSALQTNNVNVHFGWNAEYPSGEYGGLLDEVRIYKRALTQTEIQQVADEAAP
jgi:hypothetical protein